MWLDFLAGLVITAGLIGAVLQDWLTMTAAERGLTMREGDGCLPQVWLPPTWRRGLLGGLLTAITAWRGESIS